MSLFHQARMISFFSAVFLSGAGHVFSQEKSPDKDVETPKARQTPPGINLRFGIGGPVIGRAKRQTQKQIVDGVRTITITDENEKVEIVDRDGKEITLKHTQTIGGKTETTEYKAADLAALKLKSPEAAKLYEKYTEVPGAQVIGGARFQFAIPINGRRPEREQMPVEDELEPSNFGPRRIRVDQGDQKIEIHDGFGTTIRVKINKIVDGNEQSNEVTADNIRQLRNSHPDLFRVYQKYTGIGFE